MKFSSPQQVTLYIPCYNAEKYIDECLKSIFEQTYPINEIIVIDDGSSDSSLEMIRAFNGLKIIRHSKNMGVAIARNTAVKNASCKFIAAVDADVSVPPDWLERLMINFAEDDNVAGVGGKTVEAKTSRVADRWRQAHMKTYPGDEKEINPDFLSGANNVFLKSAIESVGLYDERLGSSGEDVYISRMLKNAGYNLVYEPLAVARHLEMDTVISLMNTAWNWGKSANEYGNRYYDNRERLLEKVRFNTRLAISRFQYDIDENRSDILFLNFLEMIWTTLLDSRWFASKQDLTSEERSAKETFIALKAALRFAIRHEVVPVELGDLIIKYILSINLGDSDYDHMGDHEVKLDMIFPLKLYGNDGSLIEAMQRVLPYANVELPLVAIQQMFDLMRQIDQIQLFNSIKISALRAIEEDNLENYVCQ